MIIKHLRNKIYDTVTYDIQNASQIKSFPVERQEGIFGIEYYVDKLDKKMKFFSSHLNKIHLTPSTPIYLNPQLNNISCYYLTFQKPNYMPFSFNPGCDVWTMMQKYTHTFLQRGVKLTVQLLFLLDATEKWKGESYFKYTGYLEGIEDLSTNKWVQGIQYKLNSLFHVRKPLPIDETIEKLEQDGYSTCVRLIIEGAEPLRQKTLDKILLAFNTQRYVNGWEYRTVKDTQKFIEDMQSRNFPKQFIKQIICPSEMTGFFGGEEIDKDKLTLKPVPKMVEEQLPEIISGSKQDELVLDPDTELIVEDLVNAMNKLKLTKGEELKVVDVNKSLTLNMISFDRPADLTMDKLRKRIEDIEIEMHVEGITFDQGTKKGSIAFMYPRKDRQSITFEDMLNDKDVQLLIKQQELPIIVGMDIYGNPLIYDLAKLVHILVAGATGSGKSVFENTLLLGLTNFLSPDQLRLYLIDPKQVELSDYENFPHVEKLVTDATRASVTLNKVIQEMEDRYTRLREAGVKDIQQYNRKYTDDKWPYIVVVIDEFADLMMIDGKAEDFVQRLGQKARAAGIHMIICTQRPSVDVITGVVKANMMTRIGFTCKSHHDYKTIFDYMIPYRLVGKGDGVMSWHGNDSQFVRFQSPFNADEEIFNKIIQKWGGKVEKGDAAYNEDTESDQAEDTVDEKYLLLKKVICETGETRMKQLRDMTKMNQEKLKLFLQQLVDEGWLERSASRQAGTKLTLTDEERENFLRQFDDGDEG